MQKPRLIDTHTHVGSFRIINPKIIGWFKIDLDQLRRYMVEHNVEKVFLLAHPVMPDYRLCISEEVLNLSKLENRIIPFCTVDPRYEKISTVDRFVKEGCKGIGEIKLDIAIDHPLMLEYYDYIGEYDLPILFHMSNRWCPDIDRLQNILHKVECPMVLHGWGWWNNFNNGVIEEIMEAHDHIHTDISANSGYKTLLKDVEYTKYFFEKYSERIFYGTDFPALTTFDKTQFGTNLCHLNLIESLDLSAEAKKKILYKNALKLAHIRKS